MKQLLTLLLLIMVCHSVKSQDVKVEREFRVFKDDVPSEAVEWLVKAFGQVKRVKWYYEEGNDDETYEAKFKQKGKRYSVEFDEDGDIEDVEIRRSWKTLSKSVRSKLQENLRPFKKFKLRKIQEQWTAEKSEDLIEAIRANDFTDIEVRYEIEFRAKIDEVLSYWEGLLDDSGVLIKKRRIKTRPTDNFDF